MIDDVVSFIHEKLNNYITTKTAGKVVLENGQLVLPPKNKGPQYISLTENVINILLVNLEQEYTFRSGYNNSSFQKNFSENHFPHLYINLYLLFIPYFEDYFDSLKFLSLVIQFFYSYPFFNHHNSPELSSNIEKLITELVSLPFGEQREIWSGLNLPYLPSVLYKVRMVIFQDTETSKFVPVVKQEELDISTY